MITVMTATLDGFPRLVASRMITVIGRRLKRATQTMTLRSIREILPLNLTRRASRSISF